MTKMVSLKRTKADQKAEKERYSKPTISGDEYDYCTRLTLDGQTLKKLGLDVSKLEVEQKFTITAKAFVKSISSNKGSEYERDSLVLQMTDISLEAGASGDARSAMDAAIDSAEEEE